MLYFEVFSGRPHLGTDGLVDASVAPLNRR